MVCVCVPAAYLDVLPGPVQGRLVCGEISGPFHACGSSKADDVFFSKIPSVDADFFWSDD